MALAEICGVTDYDILKKENAFDQDVTHLSRNFQNNLQLAAPPFSNPAQRLADFSKDETGKEIKIKFDHGTTTLGFQYKGGVVLAVDSRATGGAFIGSQTMKKIVEINDFLLGTLAGGAADCVYWDRVLAKQCRMYELRNRERISVAAASKLMSNMVYNYKGMGLSMGMMLAGWDKRVRFQGEKVKYVTSFPGSEVLPALRIFIAVRNDGFLNLKKGPQLYYVDSEGTRTPGKVFSVGSGSIYAFGVLDSGYKWDLTDEEAYELGRRSIYHATHRDAYSGGIVRVYHMKQTGWVHIDNNDCTDMHYKYLKEKEDAENKV